MEKLTAAREVTNAMLEVLDTRGELKTGRQTKIERANHNRALDRADAAYIALVRAVVAADSAPADPPGE